MSLIFCKSFQSMACIVYKSFLILEFLFSLFLYLNLVFNLSTNANYLFAPDFFLILTDYSRQPSISPTQTNNMQVWKYWVSNFAMKKWPVGVLEWWSTWYQSVSKKVKILEFSLCYNFFNSKLQSKVIIIIIIYFISNACINKYGRYY